jgi:hypothetical protein
MTAMPRTVVIATTVIPTTTMAIPINRKLRLDKKLDRDAITGAVAVAEIKCPSTIQVTTSGSERVVSSIPVALLFRYTERVVKHEDWRDGQEEGHA